MGISATLELDTAPLVLEVPEDFAAALEADPAAHACFERLSYSQQRGYVLAIAQAKKRPMSRERRIATAVERLRAFHGGR